MLRHKNIDRICCAILAATLVLTCTFMGGAASGVIEGSRSMGYEDWLFDQSYVHTIDIVMNDWEGFIDTCTNEEYAACTVVIDGENYGNVGIRAKGNTSLSQVSSYGNDRYSFKIEFDQYENGKSYYGLDKLSLNNLIQDSTYMKDYLAYTMMKRMGVAAPLCSYVQVNVNGKPWGLYLAVEAVEDGFLTRNYGVDHGDLYKPDNLSMGGGRGNGRDFDMSKFSEMFGKMTEGSDAWSAMEGFTMPDGMMPSGGMSFWGATAVPESTPVPESTAVPDNAAGSGGMSSGGMTMPDGMMGSGSTSASDGMMGSSGMPSGDMTMPDGMMGSGGMPSDGMMMPDGMMGSGGMPSGGMTTPDGFEMPGAAAAPEAEANAQAEEDEQTSGRASGRDFGGMNFGFGGMGSSDVMLQYIDEDPDSYSSIFSSAKTAVSGKDQERLIEALRKLSQGETLEEKLEAVDAEAMIRYLVVHSFMVNGDSYTGSMIHNYYLYEEDGRLSMLPWDYNLSFGAFSMGGGSFGGSGATSDVNSPIDTPVTSGDVSSRPIIAWIFESEEYTERYHEVYAEFIEMIYENGWLAEEIDRVSTMLAPYVQADENGYTSYEQFVPAIETMKEFCALRCESIAGQLDGSIPSTSAEQSRNSAALIDASHVDLSAMGGFGMGGMGGKGGFEMPGGMTMPDMGDFSGMMGGFSLPDGMTVPDGFGGSGMNGKTGGSDRTGRFQSSGNQAGRTQTAKPDTAAGANGSMKPDAEAGAQPTEQPDAGDEQNRAENVKGRETGSFRPSSGGMGSGTVGTDQWMMLAVCAAVLLAGVIAAKSFRSGR